MDQPPPSTFPPSSREHPSFIMQASPALSKLEALYNEIMLSSSSTRDARTTLCLRDADQIYLYPQTPAGIRLMKGVRPVGYNVAIKTYPPAIRSLLIHSGNNAKMALLEDLSVLPIVDDATYLYQAKTHNAAILRDEEALVVWSMGNSETIGTQLREWESRIVRSVSQYERLSRQQSQISMPPSMFTPSFSDWLSECVYEPSVKHELYEDIPPLVIETSSDLPSLLELETLHNIDGHSQSNSLTVPMWPSPSYDSSLLPYSPLSSPSLSPSSLASLSPYSSQSSESSLEPSPFLTGTICLADISPAPQSFDDTSLPDEDEESSPVDSTYLSPPSEDALLPVNFRKIRGLPSRSISTSPRPLSPLSLPTSPASSQVSRELSASPSIRSPSPSVPTSTTPLLSSLSLHPSPPAAGKKRKTPTPSPKASSRFLKASTSAQPIASSSKRTLSSHSLHGCDGDIESELSDLDADSSKDEDFRDPDEDLEMPPPPKKSKTAAPKASPKNRRRGGKPSGNKKRKFKCEKCSKKFTREADKHRHQHTACEGASKWYSCTICGNAFARTDALKRHITKVHIENAKAKTEDDDEDEDE